MAHAPGAVVIRADFFQSLGDMFEVGSWRPLIVNGALPVWLTNDSIGRTVRLAEYPDCGVATASSAAATAPSTSAKLRYLDATAYHATFSTWVWAQQRSADRAGEGLGGHSHCHCVLVVGVEGAARRARPTIYCSTVARGKSRPMKSADSGVNASNSTVLR